MALMYLDLVPVSKENKCDHNTRILLLLNHPKISEKFSTLLILMLLVADWRLMAGGPCLQKITIETDTVAPIIAVTV